VLLDFPLAELEWTVTARVIHWNAESDIAALEVMEKAPAGTRPVHLVTADDLWGHHFRAFGFPTGYDSGVWASGQLLGREATGWIQVEDTKVTGHRVQPGFSGTPVWDE
jgi:S1-C subfamily serine protease